MERTDEIARFTTAAAGLTAPAIDRPRRGAERKHDRRVTDRLVPLHTRAERPDQRVGRESARRASLFRRSLALADAVAAMVAVATISLVTGATLSVASLITAGVVVFAAKVSRLYDRDEVRLRKSTLEEVPALFQLAGLSALLVWMIDGRLVDGDLSRMDVLALWGVLFLAIAVGRVFARHATTWLCEPERCLIVGDPDTSRELLDKLAGRGAEVVGLVPFSDRRRPRPGALHHHDPCASVEDIVRRTGAHRVIVVPGSAGDSESMLTCVSRAQAMGVHVSVLPRMCEVIGSSVEFDHVDGVTLLGVHRFGLSRSSQVIKRAIDLVGAGCALVAAAPILAVAALAIKIESPGPVFFRQPRMGRRERPFAMLKFRSMYDGAEQARAQLAARSHAGEGLFKVQGDPRVTRVGRVLRRFSIDELPQLINVMRGDMSLVGPRPLVLDEDRRIEGRHRRRLQLAPGITGPWQVLGTAERRVPLREMVTLDYLYVGNWSLWTDVKIILRTVVHVFRGRGL